MHKNILLITLLVATCTCAGQPDDRPIHLFLAGDSTMATRPPAPANPERGWGEALPWFLGNTIVVDNRALNGRSSLSFRTEGHWNRLIKDVRPGDFVLIQFGHNDQKAYDPARYAEAKTSYKQNLQRFIMEVKSHGGHPMLATSIVRRDFNEAGDLIDTHGDYPETVRQLAGEMQIPVVDLEAKTRKYVQQLGAEKSREFYLWPTAGKYARFPDGNEDNTHLSLLGATIVAQFAVEELLKMRSPLTHHLSYPGADFLSITWIELSPKAVDDNESEISDDKRVSNVRNPSLGVFRTTLGSAPRPAVVVCPGGGYAGLSIVKEGFEVARWLNSLGIDAYVLKYRMKEFGYPAPLRDVTSAVRYLRANAQKLGLDAGKIGVLGFSAGGHVAGMATTLHDSPDAGGDGMQVSARPDFAVLAYPVVTMKDPFAHKGSRLNLLGKDFDSENMDLLSLESRVDTDTPPVFLFHTADDAAVPVENSIQFASAMSAHQRPFALHVTASAPHGIGMRPGYGPASNWPMVLADWLVEQGIIDEE